MRRRYKSVLKHSKLYCTCISLFIGLCVAVLCMSGFSLLLTYFDASDGLISFMAGASLCAGGYTSGRYCAKRMRQNGMLYGLLCGFSVCVIVFIVGMLFIREIAGAGFFKRLVMVIVCSVIGGVYGVNTKITKPSKYI